ncbi:MAG: hypothetical protein ABIJ56_20940 [Pseudomonadota bacterium]
MYTKVEPAVSPVLEGILSHPLYLKAAGKTLEAVYRAIRLRRDVLGRIYDFSHLARREKQDEILHMVQVVKYETQDMKEELEDLKKQLREMEEGKDKDNEKND